MVAAGWVRRLIDTAERIALFPSSGRVVPEVDRPDIREVILENYRIVYLVGATRIAILTVFRRPPAAGRRRPRTGDLQVEPRRPPSDSTAPNRLVVRL
jgi:plasmid stabilization system protein ParE